MGTNGQMTMRNYHCTVLSVGVYYSLVTMSSTIKMSIVHSEHCLEQGVSIETIAKLKRLFCFKGQKSTYYSACLFHCTHGTQLKSMFSEEEQNLITSFINNLDPKQTPWTGKLRPLNQVFESLPSKGPINNLNDLLEKFALSSSSAVSVCNTIIKLSENPDKLSKIARTKQRVLPRKIYNLVKAFAPAVENPKVIKKFTASVLTENYFSYSTFESLTPNWQSQLLKDWNVCKLSDLSTVESILEMWRVLPQDEHYVVHNVPARGSSFIKQGSLLGALMTIICAKNDFKDDTAQKAFQARGNAPARHFNFVLNNELVSPLGIVSNKLDGSEVSTPDDHVFSRSLAEVTFDNSAVVKYNAYSVDCKDSLCQSLLLSKAFIELLKELLNEGAQSGK